MAHVRLGPPRSSNAAAGSKSGSADSRPAGAARATEKSAGAPQSRDWKPKPAAKQAATLKPRGADATPGHEAQLQKWQQMVQAGDLTPEGLSLLVARLNTLAESAAPTPGPAPLSRAEQVQKWQQMVQAGDLTEKGLSLLVAQLDAP